MTARLPLLSLLVVMSAGCSSILGGGADENPKPGPDGTPLGSSEALSYTVSYRNLVRVPANGTVLDADQFSNQLKVRDPVGPVRCRPADAGAYHDVVSYLGGIEWTHPVGIVKDSSLPLLYDGKKQMAVPMSAGAGASNADAKSAAPVIERPDLVGVKDGIGVFLSKQHGLLSVDARGPEPKLSCAMKLPGEPKNFLFHNGQLVVIVNARGGGNRSALVRYGVDGDGFHFVDAVRLEDQIIEDSRLFDSTIVAYTTWGRPRAPSMPTPAPMNGGGVGGASDVGGAKAAPAGYYGGSDRLGSKVIVVQWDDALAIDWQDSLLDDPTRMDPMEGMAPNTQFTPDQVVSTNKRYQGFVAASDRYVAVPRVVSTTRFQGYTSYSYQVCTNYNPHFEEISVCSVDYKQAPNPDYQPPSPTTGDYSCNGQTLAACIQQAAPVVSQYIYVPVGQSCHSEWQGRCMQYETKVATYPQFKTDQTTELSIYRFEAGSFTKLDSSLAKMVQKSNAIAFEKTPLAVPGQITSRNQIQFQNGELYVFADNALQTMAVAGNSISYLNRLGVTAGTDSGAAIVFSPDRAMISSRGMSYPTPSSNVEMIDLTVPTLPQTLNAFSMPGTTTQLILATRGILGPGTVSFTNQQVSRTLEKLTLFSKASGAEQDNLLLGTEYDAFDSSWFDPNDDQRIRMGGDRLFLPYSGQKHFDTYAPTAHRLNITRVDDAKLVSERSFDVRDDVIRTASIDDARSLVFGNSAAYLVDHTSGDWVMKTLRELFVPFATYRLDDHDLYADVTRIGSSCKISTHQGDSRIFEADNLGELEIPCGDGLPIGFKDMLLFDRTRTGVKISADGRVIQALSAPEVEIFLGQRPKGYCRTSDAASGSPVDFLDTVPAQIICTSSDN